MRKGIRMLPDVRTDAKMCSDTPAASSFRSPVITCYVMVRPGKSGQLTFKHRAILNNVIINFFVLKSSVKLQSAVI